MAAAPAERRRRSRGSWLRLVLFNVIFVGLPLGIYFVFYVDARVEQTTVRNFRALDAAAKRLVQVIDNVPRIAENAPAPAIPDPSDITLIVQDEHKAELQQRLAVVRAELDARRAPPPAPGAEAVSARSSRAGKLQLRSAVVADPETLELSRERYAIERQLLSTCADADTITTQGNLRAINGLYEAYVADFAAAAGASAFRAEPIALPAAGETRDGGQGCRALFLRALDASIRLNRDDPAPCTGTGIVRRLIRTGAGVELEVEDCRQFSRRAPALARALEGDAVREVLDRYGVRVAMGLDSLVRNVVANVAPLFDQYLITDAEGQVLYLAESDAEGFRYDAVTGAPRGRRVRLDFVSQVDLRELVGAEGSTAEPVLGATLGALSSGGAGKAPGAAQQGTEWSRYGIHSRLEHLKVGDIGFTAFLHPFLIDGLQPLPHPDDPNGERSPVLYMIGIVNRDELSRESLRLRLSLVGDALLVIGVLFASMSLIWLWTAGDRLVLGPRHLLVVFVTGLTSTLLSSLLVLHVGARNVDAASLDQALELVSERIRADFVQELGDRLDALALATAAMVRAGEAPARLIPVAGEPAAGATPVGNLAEQVAAHVESRFTCRPPGQGSDGEPPAWPPGGASDGRFPSYDLAFLLDRSGRQWQCVSYRLFDTPPLDLAFRQYFQHPRDGRLWHTAVGPGFFIDRVTSVLDGTTETVLSAHPSALCASGDTACAEGVAAAALESAVIIGRLHSLEEALLPPHLRFAVVENQSGATLFHSVRNRALATNFIKQTEGAPALLSHIDAGSEGFVDLEYHGTSIRAFAAPLDPALPWTLVTYRGHELEDTLGAIAVSATATSMVGLWLLLAVVLMVGWMLVRRRITSLPLPALSDLRAALSLMLLAGVVALPAVALLLPAAGAVAATGVLLATPLAVAAVVLRSRSGRRSLDDVAAAAQRRELVSILGCVMVLLAVLPALGLFAYFRSEVSGGLGHYLRQATAEDVVAKCQRHRDYARRYKGAIGRTAMIRPDDAGQWSGLFDYGWTLTDARVSDVAGDPACAAFEGASAHQAAIAAALPLQATRSGPRMGVLEMSSFSSLADDLVVRAGMVGPSAALNSPGAVIDRLLGRPDGGWLSRLDWQLAVVLLLLGTLAALLVRLTASSLVDRVLGCHTGIARLPEARIDRPPSAWLRTDKGPLHACVVHRSENLCALLISTLLDERFATARRARWTGSGITWHTIDRRQLRNDGDDVTTAADAADAAPADDGPVAGNGSVLHVVEGFERLLMDAAARKALLEELEQLMSNGASLLVCSRILPGYWLAKLTEEAVSDLPDVPEDVAHSTRWSYVIGPLDVRRIRDRRELLIRRFDRELERLGAEAVVPDAVRRSMLKEGIENPELLNLAAAVARYAARNRCPPAEAMQRFTAGAAGHFHELWATSSYEERLQLYALARTGFANPTQSAVLSSLANRGLITSSGVVQLRSPAFGRFIAEDLVHDALLAWRDEGHGNRWKSIWPPLVIIVVLALTFFVSSTPEALAPLAVLLAAGLGAVPVVGSVIRSLNDLRQSSSAGR